MKKKQKSTPQGHNWWEIFFIRIFSPADLLIYLAIYMFITKLSDSLINIVLIIIIFFVWIKTQTRIRRKFDIDDPLKVE